MIETVPIASIDDIFDEYRGTPIEKLLCYHNFDTKFEQYDRAEMLIAMCIDHRKYIHMPDNFAYVIRSAGANLRNQEFQVSFAIGVGNVKACAVIGHNECAMATLDSRKDEFIEGLVKNASWTPNQGEEQFNKYLPLYQIGDEREHTLNETERLNKVYPSMLVAPLFFNVHDNKISQLKRS